MTALHRLLCAVLGVVLLAISTWLCVRHYGAERYRAGHAAAVAAGRAQLEREIADARKTELDLCTQLRDKDAAALTKEKEYATNLEAAQRRVRAGVDRLRWPGPVPAAAPPSDRPAASGPASNGEGPAIVPEVAAEILGDGADVAGLVRRYERVVERFEACRAVNAQ